MLLPLLLTLWMQTPRFNSPSCVAGQGWSFVIADAAKSPRWRATDDAPPLSPRAAERAARAFLRRMACQDAGAWAVHQIALQPAGGERDAWVYLVEFTEPLRVPKGTVGSVMPRVVDVPVLLDGKVPTMSSGPWPPR